MSTIKERLLKYLEYKGITVYQFSQISGIARSNFASRALSSELGSDKIVKILNLFPDLSSQWLLLEQGDMIVPSGNTKESPHLREPISNTVKVKQTKLPEVSQSLDSTLFIQILRDKDLLIRNLSEENGRLKEIIRQKDEQITQLSSSLPPHIPTESELSFITPKVHAPHTEEYTLK